ncbi:TraR/DksA C4-type zinc finger protein [Alicyclobacillus acidiphilus]|uniref:TraR/DksA C4-type zinc finger protein n=1 Tax=Alicyclobacillus acidiphilus TaxID=182455 RepID=UPI00083724D0|nr:TraR/DksA C4-type zinc finger protein [Alicyclobacillus acidiphilus]
MNFEQLRAELTAAREDARERIAKHRESADLGDSMPDEISELSMYDNHPADVASELFLRGMAVGDTVRDEAHLEEIEAALRRMDEGTYGQCVDCGETIPMDRLQAMPTTKYCIDCQKAEEVVKKERHRPIEEEVLAPGFGAVWRDGEDQTAFDGEDAYQAVARFEEPAFGEEYYEQPELDDNVGYVDRMDGISQEMYERTLPSSAIYLPDYDEGAQEASE